VETPSIVLGLGNPGPDYEGTRHNLGFRVLDLLAQTLQARFTRQGECGRRAWTAEVRFGDRRLVLAKPRTYMNRSGRAASALCRHYGAEASDFLVVCDDADLELGRLRIRGSGRAGGHNGLRSLIEQFGHDGFPRVKLGVRGAGRVEAELSEYVLAAFDPGERAAADRLVERGAQAVLGVLEHGVRAAMNLFNGPDPGMPPPASDPPP
jgi:PTH1 family peptidyl-tRNA hydrolase